MAAFCVKYVAAKPFGRLISETREEFVENDGITATK